jgi:hypothetical protein
MAVIRQIFQRFNQLRGRRVFILPTRFGLLYGCFLLLILLASINYSNSLGHVLCFLLASMGQLAIHYTYRNMAKIELLNAYADAVFLGQKIPFHLIFTNPTNHDCYQISVSSKQSASRSWNPFKNLTGYQYQDHQALSCLTAQQHTPHLIAVTSTKRGQQVLGQIRIATHFPIGLFNTWTYFNSDCAALVFPKPEGALPLPSPKIVGQQSSGRPEKGVDDFSGFKPYRSGDPIHAIAWKALPRDNVLRTKQFSSTISGDLILSWQDTAELDDIEKRLSQLCRWLLDAENNNLDYGLDLPALTIQPGQGHAHQQRCLTALALYES